MNRPDEGRRMTDEGANQHSRPRWWLRLLVLAVVGVCVAPGGHSRAGCAHGFSRGNPSSGCDCGFRGGGVCGPPIAGAAGAPGSRPRSVSPRRGARHYHHGRRRGRSYISAKAGLGDDYLMRHGVPERSLIAETQGRDTSESAVRVAVIMRANGLRSCVAVSDAYHVFRIRKLLEHEGDRTRLRSAAPGVAAANDVAAGSRGAAGSDQLFAVEAGIYITACPVHLQRSGRDPAELHWFLYQPSRSRSAVMWATWWRPCQA